MTSAKTSRQNGRHSAPLDMLRRIRPSAILLDLSMPMVDGWQFLRCYQYLTGGPLPIVAAAANVSANLGDRLRAPGVLVENPPRTPRHPLDDDRWAHLFELTAAVTRRLDASHALLIRAEDTLGWSRGRIQSYYAEGGAPHC